MADIARAQAQAIDGRLARGEDVGLLAGIPITVKDIFCVKDTPSTAASRILANFVSPYTATPVERMLSAGAVLLGKVNLDEFTYGSSSESSAFQPATRNPWNTARVPADLPAAAQPVSARVRLTCRSAPTQPAPSASLRLFAAWWA